VSVCLSVCLFDYLSARISQKPHTQISPNFPYKLPVAVGRSLLMEMQYDNLCTSGFVDDVVFSRNRANVPVSKTANMFRTVRQVATLKRSLPSPTVPLHLVLVTDSDR